MTYLNHLISQNTTFFQICSVLSDLIVFAFPLILIFLTIIWWKQRKTTLQEIALIIFSSSAIAALINIIVQLFITKDRPESLPWLELILNHLPTMSFPSDHAAVAMAFSVSFLLLLSKQSKNYKIIWSIIMIGSIIMGVCRTAVAVHRPTDILVWWTIGALSAYCIYTIKESIYVKKMITVIVWLENKILDMLFDRFRQQDTK